MNNPHQANRPPNWQTRSRRIAAGTFPRNRPSANCLAFSLIELLVVIAIIGTVTVLAVPAFNHLGKSSKLNSEGNKMVGLITRASQNSVTRNAMTALVVIPGDPATSQDLNAFALFQYAAGDSGWQQITKWETLKEGIVLDPAHLMLTMYPAVKPSPDLPIISYLGSARPSFQYLVFLPDRSLLHDQSGRISLVEGTFAPGAVAPALTHPGDNGPANFYRVTVLATTGRAIIERP